LYWNETVACLNSERILAKLIRCMKKRDAFFLEEARKRMK